MNLRWSQIDWDRARVTIIANEEWRPKDRDARVVPIVPELYPVLLEAYEAADAGQMTVIPAESIVVKNISRDFTVLCKLAGVERYAKPFHTLRKTSLTAWSREFPQHVVATWAGHASAETTREFYLQVSEVEYERAAGKLVSPTRSVPVGTKLGTKLADSRPSEAEMTRGMNSQVHASQSLP